MTRRCYLCDAAIPAIGNRRWVDTGGLSYGRVYVSRRGISGSGTGGTRTGLRTVCDDCAADIDASRTRSDRARQVLFECILILVVGFLFVHLIELGYPDDPPTPPAIHQQTSTSGDPHGRPVPH